MTDNELLTQRIKRIVSAQHLLTTIETYAAKWHELDKKRLPLSALRQRNDVDTGRQIGYVEVISALLDVPYAQVRDMLRNDQL